KGSRCKQRARKSRGKREPVGWRKLSRNRTGSRAGAESLPFAETPPRSQKFRSWRRDKILRVPFGHARFRAAAALPFRSLRKSTREFRNSNRHGSGRRDDKSPPDAPRRK